MDVGRERERWRVMSEPDLDLLRVQAVPEEDRGAGVAERVESSLGTPAFLAAGLSTRLMRFDGSSCLPVWETKTNASSVLVPRCRQRAWESLSVSGTALRPYFVLGASIRPR